MARPNTQVDNVIREMTVDEYEVFLADNASTEVILQEQENKKTNRESALAKLAELGLTEEEIAAL